MPWTPEEWVAIGKALEEIEKPKAEERQSTQIQDGKPGASKLDTPDMGRTDIKVASAIGVSKDTYRKAKSVIAAISAQGT